MLNLFLSFCSQYLKRLTGLPFFDKSLRDYLFSRIMGVALVVFLIVLATSAILYERFIIQQSKDTARRIAAQTGVSIEALMPAGPSRQTLIANIEAIKKVHSSSSYQIEVYRNSLVNDQYGAVAGAPVPHNTIRKIMTGADQQELLESGNWSTHFYPLTAKSTCLNQCHIGAEVGTVLGVVEVKQNVREIAARMRSEYFWIFILYGSLTIFLVTFVTMLVVARITRAIDQFRAKTSEIRSVVDLSSISEMGKSTFGFTELNQAFRAVGELAERLQNVAVDKDALEIEVELLNKCSDVQRNHLYQLVMIGLGLSSEKNIDRLLEKIVGEARRFTNAEGGTLYIKDSEGEALDFAIVQNDSLGVFMGGSGEAISWAPVPLRLEDGQENHRNVSAHCALSGEPINISDVYDAKGFDFQGTRAFDVATGYRSCSMLVIPLRDHEDEIIGVLQLLNAKDRETGVVVPFPEQDVEMAMSLASQAAIALTKIRLVREVENLLDAFVLAIGDAIDEKSSYTAGHVTRVASLAEQLVLEVNRANTGMFADVKFSAEELAEIRMAALLHDVGKITTPEHLMDKATKLEAIFDRMELVRHRVEISRLNDEIIRLASEPRSALEDGQMLALVERNEEWQGVVSFLDTVNQGSEWLSPEGIEKVRRLAGLTYSMCGVELPLLGADEVMNLCIQKGTLNDAERRMMNRHVEMSIKMLEGLPFPKKLCNVPTYAGMHHEKINGRGYPLGLQGDAIPLPARMLALADILEALTAEDRPYRPGKTLSEAMVIIEKMIDFGELDGDLFDLAVDSGMIVRFAQNLTARQKVDFSWRGKSYSVSE
ncbi:MAG: hypothetical protein A2520_09705 [Deltaproteobacteria bacterium RIFOXYD12_FULL_53_23]|nr:MAG: hypothetical protein A2520_09705 [Deltaproteobacteria bacterium RIFOXYD12_FULL_53_23]